MTLPPGADALGDRDQPMSTPAFEALAPDGGVLVLLPRLLDNAVNDEAVLQRPKPTLRFARATSTHVFYLDAPDGGPARWSFLRRAAR